MKKVVLVAFENYTDIDVFWHGIYLTGSNFVTKNPEIEIAIASTIYHDMDAGNGF